jgi:hypothetical protein
MSMPKGPKPFSTEWLEKPAAPPERPRRLTSNVNQSLLTMAPRLPSERTLSMIVVIVLVLGSFWFAAPKGTALLPAPVTDPVSNSATAIPTIPYDDVEEPAPTVSTDPLTVVNAGEAKATETPAEPPTLNLSQEPEQANTQGGIFPANRVLTFYGFPGNEDMGILGEYQKEDLLDRLREQAAEYEEADPTRPVLIAMEVIASVAQGEPQADGSYLLDAPAALLDEYTEFAEENGILLIFDVQIGYRTVKAEVEGLRPWLEKPFVHLAIDPEFAMRDGEIPGDHIGQIDGSDVTWAQNYLVGLTKELGIPPKILIVHQFLHSMIENKDTIQMVEGVQLVIDSDGFGPPSDKRNTYSETNGHNPIEYNGVKLFYEQDKPLMTAEQVLELDPVPDLIIYQ